MKKINILLVVLGIALAFVSCDLFKNFDDVEESADTVVVNFNNSTSSKGIDYGVDTLPKEVGSLYWSYTAKKTDNGMKYGEKLSPVNVTSGIGLNANIRFSIGGWDFVLYGFDSAETRTNSTTVELAKKNSVYIGEKSATLTQSNRSENITVNAKLSTDVSDVCGTLKISVTPEDNSHVIKFYITCANGYSTTWATVPSEIKTSETSCTLFLALFDAQGEKIEETSKTNILIYKGLVTEVSGTWDAALSDSPFDVKIPWIVRFETGAGSYPVQNLLVKDGECVATPSDFAVGDVIEDTVNGTEGKFEFRGWTTETNPTSESAAFDFATPITSDITLYAKWLEVTP